MARKRDKQPPKTKKYFRPTKAGAGMTKAGVAKYRRDNPGSKLKTAVTGKVKPGSKAAKRRKSFCAKHCGHNCHCGNGGSCKIEDCGCNNCEHNALDEFWRRLDATEREG